MKRLNLTQGSPEWHAHRATARNASEVSAVLGCSPYMTRTELLHMRHTGIRPEATPELQRRYDDGHAIEAAQRPGAADAIGEPLYPVTGCAVIDGIELSASFDGLTMDEETGYECKSINDDLRAALPYAGDGSEAPNDSHSLPKHYRAQMEQQLMVCGGERILFVAASKDGSEVRRCWYYSEPDLRSEILAAWRQFDADLAAYVPPKAADPAPVGRAPETLPALRIEVTGMVTASNLDAFKAHALAVFEGINRNLTTDADFADAEKTVKWCGDVEDRLKAAKQHALSQTESIDALFRAIDEISAEARAVRLDLDKRVKAEKERRKGEIVAGGVKALADHVATLNTRLGRAYMPAVPADFGGCIRGLKSLASMEDKVATELARAKIAANEIRDRISENLQQLGEWLEFAHLFPDTAAIVLKAPDDCRALIDSRISAHRAEQERKLEAERARIRAEEEARAAAKVRQEQEAREAEERRQREEAEAAQRKQSDHDRINDEGAARLLAEAERVAALPKASVHQMPARAAAATPPTLKLGTICERLGFTVTADFLDRLGFPMVAQEKAAKLWRESDFPGICSAIAQHVVAVANGHREAA